MSVHAHVCTHAPAQVLHTCLHGRPRICPPRTSAQKHTIERVLRCEAETARAAAPSSISALVGIADGMSIARVCRGGRFKYRHVHTCAIDMPSAMPSIPSTQKHTIERVLRCEAETARAQVRLLRGDLAGVCRSIFDSFSAHADEKRRGGLDRIRG